MLFLFSTSSLATLCIQQTWLGWGESKLWFKWCTEATQTTEITQFSVEIIVIKMIALLECHQHVLIWSIHELFTSTSENCCSLQHHLRIAREKREHLLQHCQDSSFECDASKHRKSATQGCTLSITAVMAERKICIGRLMCFSPCPFYCFHVTTAWQPGKWDTGKGEKKGWVWILSLQEKNWQTHQFDIHSLQQQRSDGKAQTPPV